MYDIPREKSGSELSASHAVDGSGTPTDLLLPVRMWATDMARRRLQPEDSFLIQFLDSGGGPGLAVFQGGPYGGGRAPGDAGGAEPDICVPFLSDALLNWNGDLVCTLPQVRPSVPLPACSTGVRARAHLDVDCVWCSVAPPVCVWGGGGTVGSAGFFWGGDGAWASAWALGSLR
jgi:hypothetical protein